MRLAALTIDSDMALPGPDLRFAVPSVRNHFRVCSEQRVKRRGSFPTPGRDRLGFGYRWRSRLACLGKQL